MGAFEGYPIHVKQLISAIPHRANKCSINVSYYGGKTAAQKYLLNKISYKYIMEIQHVNELFLTVRLI